MSENLLLYIIVGAIIFFIFFLFDKETKDHLKAVSKKLEGKVVGSIFGPFFLKISNYKEEMRIGITKEEKYTRLTYRRFLWIRWMHPFNCNLSITPLSFGMSSQAGDILSRPFVRLADKEVKINLPTFDNKYFVRSNKPQEAVMLLQDYKRREAIEDIFGKDFLFIKANKDSISIKKPLDEEDLKAEQLRSYLEALCKFAIGSFG
jgi:hypothetical protein